MRVAAAAVMIQIKLPQNIDSSCSQPNRYHRTRKNTKRKEIIATRRDRGTASDAAAKCFLGHFSMMGNSKKIERMSVQIARAKSAQKMSARREWRTMGCHWFRSRMATKFRRRRKVPFLLHMIAIQLALAALLPVRPSDGSLTSEASH